MKIKVIVRHTYGNRLIYPANQLGHKICELMGQKSFTSRDIKILTEDLGYTFEQEVEAL